MARATEFQGPARRRSGDFMLRWGPFVLRWGHLILRSFCVGGPFTALGSRSIALGALGKSGFQLRGRGSIETLKPSGVWEKVSIN